MTKKKEKATEYCQVCERMLSKQGMGGHLRSNAHKEALRKKTLEAKHEASKILPVEEPDNITPVAVVRTTVPLSGLPVEKEPGRQTSVQPDDSAAESDWWA